MAPTLSQSTEVDCRSTPDIAAQALEILPCLRCTLIGLSVLITIILLARLLSPTRLCTKMRGSLNETERLYHGSAIAGIFSPCSQPEISEEFRRCVPAVHYDTSFEFDALVTHSLQCRVSHIEERRLRNLLQPWYTVLDMFTGHPFVIVRCIWDINVLKNRIEVRSRPR